MLLKKNNTRPFRRKAMLCLLLVAVMAVSPALGMTVIPSNRDVNLKVVNDAGARFDDHGDDTYYFFNTAQGPTQGQNALHISHDNIAKVTDDVTWTTARSGVFYMTDTGGRGWDDDGILMLAVNGTVPDNFRIHIRSSGYHWTPVASGSFPPYSGITYVPGAVDEYFTKADFTYGPQIWRPAPGPDNYYPIFNNQNMADTTNTFSIMFIDLNAGILGPGTTGQTDFVGQPVTDNGAIKIEYTVENLPTTAAFDAYAYTVSSNQGQGVYWLNRLSATGASGWFVTGSGVLPLPDQTRAPTDPDNDGLYEDMSGNGATSFSDVVLFFKNMDWIAAHEPVAAFDFSGNGAIAFKDIELLFKEV